MEHLTRRGFGKLAAGLAAAALLKPAEAKQSAPAPAPTEDKELTELLDAAKKNQAAASAGRRLTKLQDCSEPCFQYVPQKRASK